MTFNGIVFVTFVGIVLVTFFDTLSVTFIIQSHTITESLEILFKYLLFLQIHARIPTIILFVLAILFT